MMALGETALLVLGELAVGQPASAAEIATSLGMNPSTVGSALRRMRAQGLVGSDNYQRRTYAWVVEPAGDAVLAEVVLAEATS